LEIRRDLGERLEDETALAEAGVGERQLGVGRLQVAVEQQVDVQRPGSEALAAAAAGGELQRLG
jgi:hypothetical protein